MPQGEANSDWSNHASWGINQPMRAYLTLKHGIFITCGIFTPQVNNGPIIYRSKELGTIQSTFLFHGTELALNQTFLNKELHLFIVDPENVNQSVDTFVKLYNLRTRKRQEFWLLDIAHWTKNFAGDQLWNQIKADFKDLKLDLDDDLYLFAGKN